MFATRSMLFMLELTFSIFEAYGHGQDTEALTNSALIARVS